MTGQRVIFNSARPYAESTIEVMLICTGCTNKFADDEAATQRIPRGKQ